MPTRAPVRTRAMESRRMAATLAGRVWPCGPESPARSVDLGPGGDRLRSNHGPCGELAATGDVRQPRRADHSGRRPDRLDHHARRRWNRRSRFDRAALQRPGDPPRSTLKASRPQQVAAALPIVPPGSLVASVAPHAAGGRPTGSAHPPPGGSPGQGVSNTSTPGVATTGTGAATGGSGPASTGQQTSGASTPPAKAVGGLTQALGRHRRRGDRRARQDGREHGLCARPDDEQRHRRRRRPPDAG